MFTTVKGATRGPGPDVFTERCFFNATDPQTAHKAYITNMIIFYQVKCNKTTLICSRSG